MDEICKARGLDPSDYCKVEDELNLVYAWKYKFKGMPAMGLHFRHVE